MSVFVLANWLLAAVTAMVLFSAIWGDRSLLLKPSIMAVLFFHVMCQWGTAIHAALIESFLPRPWVFVLLSHGFPLIGLAVALLTWRRSARALWARVKSDEPCAVSRKNKAMLLLGGIFFLFLLVYLSQVPFRSTGLYKIVFSPADSAVARENSVKFLDDPLLRYGYTITMSVFAPLLAVLLFQVMMFYWRRRSWALAALCLAGLAVVFLGVSISGARAYSAYLILAILFAGLLRRGFPAKPLRLALAALLILAVPTILSLLREGKNVTPGRFLDYMGGSILDRVLVIPMATGLYHVHYAQEYGFFGIQAIPKLAAAAGIEPVNVPNLIARIYTRSSLSTATANTAYVYAYYSYFGLMAFVPCLIGLWLLDLSLLVFRRLSSNLLIPCVACIAIATNTFSGTEYTISLVSQGFLLILLVSWAVDRAVSRSGSFSLRKTRLFPFLGRPDSGEQKPAPGRSAKPGL